MNVSVPTEAAPLSRIRLMKRLIALLLLLPLVAAGALLPDLTDASYRTDMRFEASGALPGEPSTNNCDSISRSFTEESAAHAIIAAPLEIIPFRARSNARQLFYESVPIHKVNAVFVI